MNVLLLELRNLRRSAVTWTIAVGCVIFAMLAFFPSLQTESMQSLASAKLEGVDPALLAALGLEQLPDFTKITDFFGYVLQFIVLAVMVFATQQAVNLLVKEETDGTIEYLYAKPVSRREIFFQKVFALLLLFTLMLAIFSVITVFGYLSFSDFNFTEAVRESATFFSAITFVGLVFMSIGILLSSLIRSAKSALSATISIVFGTFVLGVLSAVVNKLDFLIYASPMDWIKTQKLLSEGIRAPEWIIGVVVVAGCITAACLRYNKKDFLV